MAGQLHAVRTYDEQVEVDTGCPEDLLIVDQIASTDICEGIGASCLCGFDEIGASPDRLEVANRSTASSSNDIGNETLPTSVLRTIGAALHAGAAAVFVGRRRARWTCNPAGLQAIEQPEMLQCADLELEHGGMLREMEFVPDVLPAERNLLAIEASLHAQSDQRQQAHHDMHHRADARSRGAGAFMHAGALRYNRPAAATSCNLPTASSNELETGLGLQEWTCPAQQTYSLWRQAYFAFLGGGCSGSGVSSYSVF